MLVKRGEIYYADLSPVVGSEQGGMRPVLIVQNDVGNKHSPTDSRRDNEPEGQIQAANTYFAQRRFLRACEGLHRASGAGAYIR